MKLRNKETGEIGYLFSGSDNRVQVARNSGYNYKYYDSLAELNAEWEDVPEEPKGFWMINILGIVEYTHDLPKDEVEMMKEIGNYFETKEEAMRAVEKLKAFRRLKDRGFRFKTIHRNPQGSYNIYANFEGHISPSSNDVNIDLNICFGDEE